MKPILQKRRKDKKELKERTREERELQLESIFMLGVKAGLKKDFTVPYEEGTNEFSAWIQGYKKGAK